RPQRFLTFALHLLEQAAKRDAAEQLAQLADVLLLVAEEARAIISHRPHGVAVDERHIVTLPPHEGAEIVVPQRVQMRPQLARVVRTRRAGEEPHVRDVAQKAGVAEATAVEELRSLRLRIAQ